MGRINNDAAFFMSYVRGEDRGQAALLPAAIEDYVAADAPVRVIDAFVDGLDVNGLGFGRSVPAATGRPRYDPRDLLKLYVYGYLSEVAHRVGWSVSVLAQQTACRCIGALARIATRHCLGKIDDRRSDPDVLTRWDGLTRFLDSSTMAASK